jgi:hypothetical protein
LSWSALTSIAASSISRASAEEPPGPIGWETSSPEFLELVRRAFALAPAADGRHVHTRAHGDLHRRSQALAIGPVVERREAIPATVGGREGPIVNRLTLSLAGRFVRVQSPY